MAMDAFQVMKRYIPAFRDIDLVATAAQVGVRESRRVTGEYRLTRHFWAVGNYSKFIKGYTRVEVEEACLPEGVVGSAYLAPDGGKLVFVTVNETGEDQAVTLAGIPEGSLGEVYETSMERTCGTAKGCMSVDNGYILPAQSVTTFVFRLV